MQIVNSARKRQISSFMDKNRNVMLKFYDAIDQDNTHGKALKEMQALIALDPDFYDTYLFAAEILFSLGENEEGIAMLKNAYERALLTIVDSKGRWPKEMLWGFLENRHIMRALEQYGILCWETGKIEEALDIFRKLLTVNPNDNQGVRYNILAIRMNLPFDAWQKPFEVEKNGEIIGLDAYKINEWFRKNAPKFKEEFKRIE